MRTKDEVVRAITDVAVQALSASPGVDVLQAVADQLATSLGVDCMTVCDMGWTSRSEIRAIGPAEVGDRLPRLTAETAELKRLHPFISWVGAWHPSRAVVLTDVMAESVWRRSPLAAETRPVLGRNLQLAMPVWLSWDRTFVWCGSRDGPFRSRDREIADALQPLVDAVTRHVVAAHPYPSLDDQAGLTEREAVILRLLATGLTAESIARRLGVSPRTVHKHLEHIYRKLGVRDRLMAVRQAADVGLVAAARPLIPAQRRGSGKP